MLGAEAPGMRMPVICGVPPSCFFSILGKRGLSPSVHESKRELKQYLLDYIARHNENPKPFVWTKEPEKFQRIIEATKKNQAAHPRHPRKKHRGKRASRRANAIKK